MTNQLNAIFSALSDPTRRSIIEQLTKGRATVSDLHDGHDMALPTFLRHLKVLESAGLVRSQKKGRVRSCQLAPHHLIEAQGWLTWQSTIWDQREANS